MARQVMGGTGEVTVQPMVDSSPLLLRHRLVALRARLHSDGYLFFRGLLNRDKVWAARKAILGHIERIQARTGPEVSLLNHQVPLSPH